MTKQQFKTAIALGYSDARSDETIRIFVENTLVTAQITNRQAALTPAQVAKVLAARGVTNTVPSTAAVCGWLRSGLLRGFRVPGRGRGGQWRVPLGNLDGFVPPSKRKAE